MILFMAMHVLEYAFRKKDNRHILSIKQEESDDSYCNVLGNLKVLIQELDHQTIEYIQIPTRHNGGDDVLKREFVCNSKPKRKHKNGDNDPWLEAPANNDTPTKWVRIDPDYEWLLHLVFFIIDHKIAITQLLHDDVRDVKSQLEAIYSLRLYPDQFTSEALLQAFNDEMNFYKIRLEAARALAENRDPDTLHYNKRELINIIKILWNKFKNGNKSKSSNDDRTAKSKKNDDNNKDNNNNNKDESRQLINYFLIKNTINYLSKISLHQPPHYTPIEIVDLILELLNDIINDDINIYYNVDSLIASMIDSFGNIRVSKAKYNKIDQVIQILNQLLSLQTLFGSHRGIIQSACLQTLIKLYLNHPKHEQLKGISKALKKFCKYGRLHDDVRCNAFKMYINTIKDFKTMRKCLGLIANERVPFVRIKMLKIWANFIKNTDYFSMYEEIADQLHRKQSNITTVQSLTNANDEQLIQEQQEEKLEAINLRPTLRGYISRNFYNDDAISICSFVEERLRKPNNVNQCVQIAQILWYFLIRTCCDSMASKKYKTTYNIDLKIDNKSTINDNLLFKSITNMFAIYNLYKTIWDYDQPKCYQNISNGSIINSINIGNQHRIHNAVEKLKSKYNNNQPRFCGQGVKLWQCF